MTVIVTRSHGGRTCAIRTVGIIGEAPVDVPHCVSISFVIRLALSRIACIAFFKCVDKGALPW